MRFPSEGERTFLLVSMAKRDKQLRIDTLSTNPTSVVSLVGNSVGIHSITQHSGTLLDAQAPQFLKTDGTRELTGNLSVAAGITIDGVDISAFKGIYDAHAVDPDAHHNAATQGNGITIDSNQVVSVRLASTSGLGFDGAGALVLADSVAGAGIAISSKVLAVDLASVSGLEFTVGGQLAVADSVAGTGLGISNKVLSVKKATVSGLNFDGTGALLIDDSIAGNGLAITNKVVRVNEGYAFNWTATHTWDSDTLVVSAEQDAVWINSGTPDGSAAFKVTPAATNDFGIYLKQLSGQNASLMRVEDASGNALITLTGGGKLQSGTPAFVSGLTGWEIAPDGTAEFNNVFVRGELHATVFSADEMHAQSGTQIIATATRVAAPISVTDNVLPAMNSTFTLVVQASWDTGLCYFANNQILVVKTMMATSGSGLDLYEVYMVVSGTPTSNNDRDLANGKPGTFDVVVTRRYGGATGIAIPTGSGVVKWGAVGGSGGSYTGAILLTSDFNHAPYIDIFTVAADVSGSATWSAPPTITPRVREGLLSGVLGLGTEWGIAMGTNLSDSSLSARYVVVSDQRVKLQNVDQTVYQSSAPRISLAATGNVKFGTDIDAAATTTFDFVASTGALRVGPGSGGASLQWTGSALEVRNSSASAVITLDGSGNSYFSGVMTIGASGEVRQGTGTLGTDYTGLRLWRSSNVGLIAGYNANTIQWQGDTDGRLKAGAGSVMLSSDGIDLATYTGSNPNPTENVKSLTFWGSLSDVGSGTVKPAGRIWGASNVSGQYGVQIEAFHPTETSAYPKLWLSYESIGYKRNLTATDFDNILLTAGEAIYLTGPVTVTGALTVAGHYIPNASLTYDIGSASKTVRKLYVSEIIADTITGGTQITGSIWQYDSGDMYVRSNASTARTLYVANPGTGTMHLDVEGNILVGGTVDGVDVSTLSSNYSSHVADSNIHHSKSHVLATTSGLGGDHTVSGLTSGQVLKATGATTAVFVQLDHSELAGLTTGDPHTQYVAIGSARTITAVHTFAPASAGAPFILSANAQGQLVTGLRADQVNKSVIAGNGLTTGGILTSDVTLNVGAGTLISVAADAVSLANGSAQYQVISTGASPFTPAYTALSTFAGNGLTFTSAFDVGAGTLISVAANAVSLANGSAQYQVISTGASPFTPAYTALSTFAGSGLSFSTAFNVNVAGLGLSIASDAVTLSSASNPGQSAAILATNSAGLVQLYELGVTTTITSPALTSDAALSITATGDITLDAAGDDVILAASNTLRTAHYVSQSTGWAATYAGAADFRNLYSDEIYAKSFIVDLEQALAGGQIISKSVATLAVAFTAPAAGATATLRVNDLPSAPNMAVFQSGDIVGLRSFSRASGTLSVAYCWGAVTSYTDQSDGTQTWTFTRSASPNAGSVTTGAVIAADGVVLDLGTSGNGYYEVSAVDGAYGANSPYWQIVSWTGHPATGSSVKARGGKLTGIFGVANEYGIAAGTGFTTSDSYLRLSSYIAQSNNLGMTWSSGGTDLITINQTTGMSLQTFDATGGVIQWGDQRVLSWAATIGAATPDGALWTQRTAANNEMYLAANLVSGREGHIDITAYGASGDHAAIYMTGGTGTNAGITLHTHDLLIDLGIGTSGTGTVKAYASQVLLGDLTTGGGDGSATEPMLSFIGDTNTGIYRSAADTLNFSTGGTSRVTITTSAFAAFSDVDAQNIIGKARIGYIGNVDGAGFQHYDMPVDTSSYALLQQANTRTYLNCGSTTDIRFRHGNTDVMMMDSVGLRIGSTASSTRELEVTGEIGASGNIYAGGVIESGQAQVGGNLSRFTGRNGTYSSVSLSAHGWGNSSALAFNAYFADNSASYIASGAFKFLGAQYTGNVTKAGMFHFDGNSNDFSWYTSEAGRASGADITTWTENLKLQDDGTLTLYGDLAWSSGGFAATWTALTYNTNWSSYGGAYGAMRYCRIGDWVLVNGMAKRTSGNSTNTVGTLPVGYRPTTQKSYYTNMSVGGVESAYKLEVTASGNIAITYTGTAVIDHLSLDCIQFRTNS